MDFTCPVTIREMDGAVLNICSPLQLVVFFFSPLAMASPGSRNNTLPRVCLSVSREQAAQKPSTLKHRPLPNQPVELATACASGRPQAYRAAQLSVQTRVGSWKDGAPPPLSSPHRVRQPLSATVDLCRLRRDSVSF